MCLHSKQFFIVRTITCATFSISIRKGDNINQNKQHVYIYREKAETLYLNCIIKRFKLRYKIHDRVGNGIQKEFSQRYVKTRFL